MLVHVRLAVLAFVVLAGCGYPALECDPDRAGELAFGYHLSGGFWASSSTLANGTEFLLIDGACQYWAHGARPSELVTGTLDAALLAEINDELLTGPWEAIDGVANPPCCDGAVVGLGRDEIRAFDATGLAGEFESLSATSHRWAEAALGPRHARDRRADPARARPASLPRPARVPPPTGVREWPLATPLAEALAPPLTIGSVVLTGTDAALVRTTRGGWFVDGETTAAFYVIDVVPFADETGCLRPLFSESCWVRSVGF